MKKHYFLLVIAVLLSIAVVAGSGAYIKYGVMEPMGVSTYADRSVFVLPFLYFGDADFRQELYVPVSEPATEPSVTLSFSLPTGSLEPSVPETTQPETTSPSVSEPTVDTQPSATVTEPTAAPTEPTAAPTEPTAQPTVPTTGPTEPTAAPTEPTVAPTEPTVTTPPVASGGLKPGDAGFSYPGQAVDDSWFDNVLFIGDSRTTGLKLWYRSGNAHYFAAESMSVMTVNSWTVTDNNNFVNAKLAGVLASHQYDKVFINLGLNEAWMALGSFQSQYAALVDQIRAAQPDAVIILQGIMMVTKSYAATEVFDIDNIQPRNDYIQSLANGVDIFYIDVNEYFTDEEGYLLTNLTSDGCHPTSKGYSLWRDWIAYIVGTLGI